VIGLYKLAGGLSEKAMISGPQQDANVGPSTKNRPNEIECAFLAACASLQYKLYQVESLCRQTFLGFVLLDPERPPSLDDAPELQKMREEVLSTIGTPKLSWLEVLPTQEFSSIERELTLVVALAMTKSELGKTSQIIQTELAGMTQSLERLRGKLYLVHDLLTYGVAKMREPLSLENIVRQIGTSDLETRLAVERLEYQKWSLERQFYWVSRSTASEIERGKTDAFKQNENLASLMLYRLGDVLEMGRNFTRMLATSDALLKRTSVDSEFSPTPDSRMDTYLRLGYDPLGVDTTSIGSRLANLESTFMRLQENARSLYIISFYTLRHSSHVDSDVYSGQGPIRNAGGGKQRQDQGVEQITEAKKHKPRKR
jgi:hypothetical protein